MFIGQHVHLAPNGIILMSVHSGLTICDVVEIEALHVPLLNSHGEDGQEIL